MRAPEMAPRVVILRHAERPPLPDRAPGDDVLLTQRGRDTSRSFGRTLQGRLAMVVSSPVARCVETASCIAEGANVAISVRSSSVLGDPGPFVTDPVAAWQAWLELGQDEMMARLIAGGVDRPGFRDRATGSALVATLVRNTLAELAQDAIAVLVTHDAILGPVAAEWVLRAPTNTPAFLEGATCWLHDARLLVEWRDHVGEAR